MACLVPVTESFDIVVDNTFPSTLSFTPEDNTDVILYINGIAYDTLGATPVLGVAGTTLSFSAVNAQFNMTNTDNVIVQYWANI